MLREEFDILKDLSTEWFKEKGLLYKQIDMLIQNTKDIEEYYNNKML